MDCICNLLSCIFISNIFCMQIEDKECWLCNNIVIDNTTTIKDFYKTKREISKNDLIQILQDKKARKCQQKFHQ